MLKKAPPQNVRPGIAKELEQLHAQRSAVKALIRALQAYRHFYPNLVVQKKGAA